MTIASLAATMLLGGNVLSLAADPSPAATLGSSPGDVSERAPARLPKVVAQGPITRVTGNILRSSRGRSGPVRLLVERQNGEKVAVLVAPDEYCERAGLSLRANEPAEIEGSMLKGQRPILVATAVVVDGRTVQIRDAKGKLVPLEGAGKKSEAAGSGAAGASEQSEGKASLSGGRPSAPATD